MGGDPDEGHQAGGAVKLFYSDATFLYCVFHSNSAGLDGGVMSIHSSAATIRKCTIAYNECGRDGAALYIFNHEYVPKVENCIVAFNEGSNAIHCFLGGDAPVPSLTCCDVYGPPGGDWVGCIADQYGINGNFSEDPLFVDAGAADFHLQEDSPCTALNSPSGCGLIGALNGDEGCPFLGRCIADASWLWYEEDPPHYITERTRDTRDGARGRYQSTDVVCFLSDMVREIEYCPPDEPCQLTARHFGLIQIYDPVECTLLDTLRLPDRANLTNYADYLGLAYNPNDDTYWYSRGKPTSGAWLEKGLYHIDSSGNELGYYDIGEPSITGLAIDPEHNHLWVAFRGEPDQLEEYDISTGVPESIQGPMDVPWPLGPWGGCAGLAYDDELGRLVTFETIYNSLVYFWDNERGYEGPGSHPPGVRFSDWCVVNPDRTLEPWGLAILDRGEEQMVYLAANPYGGPRPVDLYGKLVSGIDEWSTGGPSQRFLLGARPNPTSGGTMIWYFLPTESRVRLDVVDVTGRRTATLVDGMKKGGLQTFLWSGHRWPSGIYYLKLSAGEQSSTRKVVIAR